MKTFTATFTTQGQQTEALLAMRTHAENLQRIMGEYQRAGDFDQAAKYCQFLLAANNAADAIGNATAVEVLQ
jgi:hypothetical protein